MGEGFMKSALERALERAERIEVPKEKIQEMENTARGQRIAAAFLREPGYNLQAALREFDAEASKQVARGIESVFLQNMMLPKKEQDKTGNDKAIEGLLALKSNKGAIRRAKEQLDNLSSYYLQARKQNYEQLKADYQRAISQAIQQKMGPNAGTNINVEQSPDFQDKWRQLSSRLDAEYDKALNQFKQEIKKVS